MEQSTLLAALNSVTTIPVIPFKDGQIDFDGHRKNVAYLMGNNYLSDNRPRVIAIGGTSLLHHIEAKDQVALVEATGQQMEDTNVRTDVHGILISGIVPNPISQAEELIRVQSNLDRVPDAYLLMPLSGINNPDGIYQQYSQFAQKCGEQYGARFLYYFRQKRNLEVVIQLINESPHFIGVKVGTDESDIEALTNGIDGGGLVMWGIGDRCTQAHRLGTRGHTSGIAVAFARASDEINNAQRSGDLAASQRIEDKIAALEEIRFRNERVYNYSAVVEAIIQSGFDDIEGGTGGPFNPRLSSEIVSEVKAAIADLKPYH